MSGFVVLVQFSLFLIFGLLFWVYYEGNTFFVAAVLIFSDRVFVYFIGTEFLVGLRGIMVVVVIVVVMSILSSSLNSSVAVFVGNFFKWTVKCDRSEESYLCVLCIVIFGFGVS